MNDPIHLTPLHASADNAGLPLLGQPTPGPGGIRQQFKAAAPLVEQILRGLKEADGLKGPLAGEIWDDGDAVGAWTGDNLAAVLFPTAPTLERLQKLAERAPKLLLIVNPQVREGASERAPPCCPSGCGRGRDAAGGGMRQGEGCGTQRLGQRPKQQRAAAAVRLVCW
jgi:hypothetical protein